jgi:hypothetical protein
MIKRRPIPERDPLGELAGDRSIDRHQLEIEAERHPEIYIKWARRVTDATNEVKILSDAYDRLINKKKAEAERAKFTFEKSVAEIERAIRGNPVKYGIDISGKRPPTDGVISKMATLHPRYSGILNEYIVARTFMIHEDVVQAQKELREAERTAALMNAAVEAINTKRSMINYLTSLYCNGYYTPNFVTGEKAPSIDRSSHEMSSDLNKRMSNRRLPASPENESPIPRRR